MKPFYRSRGRVDETDFEQWLARTGTIGESLGLTDWYIIKKDFDRVKIPGGARIRI